MLLPVGSMFIRARMSWIMKAVSIVASLLIGFAGCAVAASAHKVSALGEAGAAEGEVIGNYDVFALADGLQANLPSPIMLRFGDSSEEVREHLRSALGEPRVEHSADNCETGALLIVTYPGNIDVTFSEGKFAGWVLQGSRTPRVATPEGVAIGTPLASAQKKLGLVRGGISPLGAEYLTNSGLRVSALDMGQGPVVSAMDAGTVCFRR